MPVQAMVAGRTLATSLPEDAVPEKVVAEMVVPEESALEWSREEVWGISFNRVGEDEREKCRWNSRFMWSRFIVRVVDKLCGLHGLQGGRNLEGLEENSVDACGMRGGKSDRGS
eukprot:481866-Hanusia_phi.AAC.1